MKVLQNLEPASVFHYFEEICAIPHTSFHEKELSNYCVAFAKEHNLAFEQDDLGNVLMIVPATSGYEEVAPIILQGHLDMVGDKLSDCPLDLEKDGIEIILDGDFVHANGTTLGADNGIAVAYALAIADATDIPHPRLEIVLTVSEEVGLIGATAMDLSSCQARRMLNIDSEAEGILTAGCAGGMRAGSTIPVERVMKKGYDCTLTLTGFLGGHSGIDIGRGRANAITAMGRVLSTISRTVSFGIMEMNGGSKENVIAKESKAALVVPTDQIDAMKAAVADMQNQFSTEFGTADPDIQLIFEVDDSEEEIELVLSGNSQERVLAALNLIPNGVQSMCADLPTLVETSLNTGVLSLKEEELELGTSIRSSVSSAKTALAQKVEQLVHMLGGTVEFTGEYPAWPYARHSELRDLCIRIYKEQYGKEPEVELLHAGLECGLFSDKIPGLDCISFGPNLYDVHTPKEKMSISSVQRVWEYIKAILAAK